MGIRAEREDLEECNRYTVMSFLEDALAEHRKDAETGQDVQEPRLPSG